MNIRKNLNIRSQILLLPFIALFGFTVVLLMFYSSVQSLQKRNAAIVTMTGQLTHIREIQDQLNKARVAEKQFLIGQNLSDFESALNAIDSAIAHLTVLDTEFPNAAFQHKVSVWMKGMEDYKAQFIDMANELAEIGQSPNVGLRGTIRSATRPVELRLKKYRGPLLDWYIEMQRREHAYVFGTTPSSLVTWEQSFGNLQAVLDRAHLSPTDEVVIKDSLRRYKKAFDRLVVLKKNLSEDEGIVNSMSAKLVQTFSGELKKISNVVLRETTDGFAQTQAGFLNVVALLITIAALVFLFGRWVGNGICEAISGITANMQELANGNLDVDIPAVHYDNQIGKMANALVTFRESGKERRRVRLQLREANRQTQNVIRSMQEALIEVDKDGTIVMANPAAECLTGLDLSKLIGTDLKTFLPVSGIDRPEAHLELLKTGIENLFENDPDGYRDLVSHAPVGLLGFDSDGMIICSSPKADEIFGYDADAMIGQKIDDLLPDTRTPVHQNFLDACGRLSTQQSQFPRDLTLRRRDNVEFPTRAAIISLHLDDEIIRLCILQRPDIDPLINDMTDSRLGQMMAGSGADSDLLDLITPHGDATEAPPLLHRADGTKVPVDYSGALLRDRDNNLNGAICVLRDVSERNAAQREILRFKSSLDSTADAVFMFHPGDLKFIYLNDEAKRLTGWSDAQYRCKTPVDMNPIFDEKRFRMLTKPLIFGTQKALSLTTTGLDGKEIELTVQLFEPDDDEPWFVVTTRDISKRIVAERESQQLRKTLDQINDEIYMFRPDTLEFLYQNRAARKLSGWSSRQYLKKTLMDNNPDFDRDTFLKRAEPLFDGSEKQIVYRKTGKGERPIEVSLQLIKPAGGEPRFVAITRDISQQLAAERAKTDFISTVSHELRTPLTSIKGALGIIESGAVGELGDKLKSLISIASTNSNRLIRLINDILDIEKLEAGKMDIQLQPMDICPLLHEAIEANESYAATYGVRFDLSGTDAPVMVSGDRDRLMQVMANLMSNAAKFSDKGATVKVGLKVSDTTVRVSVKDTGSGIPADAQATIFDKFTQADSSDQRQKGGTGLGLSIVKHMIEAHGGTIDFQSVEGKGTTFYFDLELLEDAATDKPGDRRRPPAAAMQANSRTARLLICEDDDDTATVLGLILKQAGYDVDIAQSIAEAKALLSTRDYAGMTLDLGLPDGNGLDLLSDMRAEQATRDIPVFVVSANIGNQSESDSASGIGVVDWISKPIDEQRLVRVLHSSLERMPQATPAILHVEDDENIRTIIKSIIGERARVYSADSVATARAQLAAQAFDLVILDLGLPDGSGQDILPFLNKAPQQATPVLVFSANDAPADIATRVQAVLVKSKATNKEFLEMIRKTLEKVAEGSENIAAE